MASVLRSGGKHRYAGRSLLLAGAVRSLVIGLCAATYAFAGSARIDKITAEIVEGSVLTSFELKGGLTARIASDLHDGIKKDFYYYLLLNQKYEEWFDKEVVVQTLRYAVQYDTVKKIYTVDRIAGPNRETRIFDTLEAMQTFVMKVHRVAVAPAGLLKPNERYFVRVKAQVKAAHVPLALDRFLFFIPFLFLDLDTPWAQSVSLYAPSP